MTYKVLVNRWLQRYLTVNDNGYIISTDDIHNATRFTDNKALGNFIKENRDALQHLDDTFRVEEYIDVEVTGNKAKSETNES